MQGLRPEILAGIPDEMYYAVRRIEDSFVVGTPDLRRLTNHFEGELQKGLDTEGSDIPMNVTWVVGFPTGKERGRYLAVDFGGTNVRVCSTLLCGREEEVQMTQEKYKVAESLKTSTADELWGFVAGCVGEFMQKHSPELAGQTEKKLPLAFTFSYPVTQTAINSGVLQRWTKALEVSGVEGHDVVAQFQCALDRKKVPVEVVALVNDTVGALISAAYRDPEITMSSVISTGCNAAYMENIRSIKKIESHTNRGVSDVVVSVNTEFGAYNNSRQMLPLTNFDEDVDRMSTRPGTHVYEKMIAGLYLGELYRLVLLQLHRLGMLLTEHDVSALKQPNIIDASFLSVAEADMTQSLEQMRNLFKNKLGIELNPEELRVCRYIVELVGTRAARLYACGIAALCRRTKMDRVKVGVDGAVFHHYTHFKERARHALREILDWPQDAEDYVSFHDVEDGSGLGAAIVAAMALQKREADDLKPRPGL